MLALLDSRLRLCCRTGMRYHDARCPEALRKGMPNGRVFALPIRASSGICRNSLKLCLLNVLKLRQRTQRPIANSTQTHRDQRHDAVADKHRGIAITINDQPLNQLKACRQNLSPCRQVPRWTPPYF